MPKDKLHSVFGTVVCHLFRIFGLLPLSMEPDFTGFPEFSKYWCFYSFVLVVLFSFYTIQTFFNAIQPMTAGHIITTNLFWVICRLTNWIACKTGVFRNIIQNFAKFDEKVICLRGVNRVVVLYTLMLLCLVIMESNIYANASAEITVLVFYYPIAIIMTLVTETSSWVLFCLMTQRMNMLNYCLKCLVMKTAWTVRRVEIISTRQDLSSIVGVISELYNLLMENISLIKYSFELQILANYTLLYDQAVMDSITLQIYLKFVVDFLYVAPWLLTILTRLLFISWLTSSLTMEIETSCRCLTRIVSSRMSSSVRRQIKTLRLKITHQSMELSSFCFSIYKLDEFLPVV